MTVNKLSLLFLEWIFIANISHKRLKLTLSVSLKININKWRHWKAHKPLLFIRASDSQFIKILCKGTIKVRSTLNTFCEKQCNLKVIILLDLFPLFLYHDKSMLSLAILINCSQSVLTISNLGIKKNLILLIILLL